MWHNIWHLQISVGEKVVRAILVYVALLVALRIFGKRELGQSNTLDLVVLLLVANAVQNGIIGNDVSVTGALIGAAVLFAVNDLFSRGVFQFPWLSWAIEGTPTTLIDGGRPDARALRREQISLPALRSIARRQGFEDLSEVDRAILETNGVVTMFREGEPGHDHRASPGGLGIGKRRRGPERG